MFFSAARRRRNERVRDGSLGDSREMRAKTFVRGEHTCHKTMQAFHQPGRPYAMTGRVKKLAVSTGSLCPTFSSWPSKRIVNSMIRDASSSAACFP
jgi:hypothetical protein